MSKDSAPMIRTLRHSEGVQEYPNGRFWIIYVGESHPTHTVLWKRFAVDTHHATVFIVAPLSDTLRPAR